MRSSAQRLGGRLAGVKDVAALCAAGLLGMAVAATAIGLAPRATIDPSLKTLAGTGERFAPLAAPSGNCRFIAYDKGSSNSNGRVGRLVCEE